MLLASSVLAYGEGHAEIVRRVGTASASTLSWAGDFSECIVLYAGENEIDAHVALTLPDDGQEEEVCVLYSIRWDRAHNWWFVAPPPAEPRQSACATRRRDATPTIIPLDVGPFIREPGYFHIVAVLQQARDSTVPLAAPLTSTISVVQRASADALPWLRSTALNSYPRVLATLPNGMASRLAESYRVVREDEQAEKEEYVRRTHEGRQRHTPLHAWEAEAAAAAEEEEEEETSRHGVPLLSPALRRLLAPKLLAALTEPVTPAKLWPLITTPSDDHLVFQLRVLSEAGASLLASELDHAHEQQRAATQHNASYRYRAAPTNNVSDTAGNVPPVRAVPADANGVPSLLLDEVGLRPVAHALAREVLAPLGRLLYPEWTCGGSLDSYHAFTIHRRCTAADQQGWFRPSSNSEGIDRREGEGSSSGSGSSGSGSSGGDRARNSSHTAGGRGMIARAGVHSDICEISMNLALRVTPDLQGSRVGFEPGFHGRNASAPVLWLEHTPGVAFVNLCQHRHGVDELTRGGRDTVVVRGFASSFRRAPAEGFYQRCVARDKTRPESPGADRLKSEL